MFFWLIIIGTSAGAVYLIRTLLTSAGDAVASLGDGRLDENRWSLHHTSALRCLEGGYYDDALAHLEEARRCADGLPGVEFEIDQTLAKVHDAISRAALARGEGHLARAHREAAAQIRGATS